jgi:hypothetical protein
MPAAEERTADSDRVLPGADQKSLFKRYCLNYSNSYIGLPIYFVTLKCDHSLPREYL